MMHIDPRANPLANGPLRSRHDMQRAVRDLHAPLLAHTSESGARVRLGSFSAVFPQRVAELEGFARPLYGIVPLTVGGGRFDHWDRYLSGLDAGTDPSADDYWGAVSAGPEQRMVEQAAIGLALAFCPDKIWDPLSPSAKDRVSDWLGGIYRFEPAPNNWHFFRVLVSLGFERVGRPFDRERLEHSLAALERYRRGEHWYVDGVTGNVDYYVPFAFHTYGLMYVAANRLGLGRDDRAAEYAERAAAFADDFPHWFGPDGAAIAYGRSMTYRFAMASFWGALAWADVPGIDWGMARGLWGRHLRWWAEKPISDRDGVLSVGFAYDNRRVAESYNSAGSPYWCMKAFGALAAPAEHPFWTTEETRAPSANDRPVTIDDAGWVLARDDDQAVGFVGRRGSSHDLFDQEPAKYDKLAYSSAFAFSGDVEAGMERPTTDSTISVSDASGIRLSRAHTVAGGVEGAMAWSTWLPMPDVRVDTVVWAGAPWHGRLHRVRTGRDLLVEEGGFALPAEREGHTSTVPTPGPGSAVASGPAGRSAIVDVEGDRRAECRWLPTNANLLSPHAQVPMLEVSLEPGDHVLSCLVFATREPERQPDPMPPVPEEARALLNRIAARDVTPWPDRGADVVDTTDT